MNKILLIFSCLLLPLTSKAEMHPMNEDSSNVDCHRWPMVMAEGWLKDIKKVRFQLDKTTGEKIASQKIKKGLVNNIFIFRFIDDKNQEYKVITKNIASAEECSISGVEVYLVSDENSERVGDYKQYY